MDRTDSRDTGDERPGEIVSPLRRTFEVGFWVAVTLVNGVANSITVLIDIRRSGLAFAAWEPAVWEFSSGLAFLALVPALLWFTRRFPLHWDTLRRHLPWHLLASVVFSSAHVLAMVAMRELAYAGMGTSYEFGDWSRGLLYEYLKDVRTYVTMVATIEGYRFVRRRLKGEARLLDAPDDVETPPGKIERPERFLVRKLGREFLVAATDIEWLQAAGNYVNLHVRGREYPLRSTIGGIEARLDPARFVRIHRSYMVNLDRVASIEPLDTGDARVLMADGSRLPCSRRYREVLRERVAGGRT
ncbi:LytTR family DNA-binding domain-containing protein [Marilutibacter chinensis]|uniref:LytTR family transcriptional regulator n=1 Tax=Marilutibacter chinensis TaxID=2912247 RepID=A0ABS9HMR9_9GAMM|nr:LytTR family DNA-binding domain-containing protein [Lysobacter chinensis]MCF7220314.1 LytTR family transcriptional regulator [Lysobacter chinensis]